MGNPENSPIVVRVRVISKQAVKTENKTEVTEPIWKGEQSPSWEIKLSDKQR